MCVYVCAPHQRSLTQPLLPDSSRANIYITNKRTKKKNLKKCQTRPHFVQEDKSINHFFCEQMLKWLILGSLSLSIDLKRIWIWSIRNRGISENIYLRTHILLLVSNASNSNSFQIWFETNLNLKHSKQEGEYAYVNICSQKFLGDSYRVAKTHRIPFLYRSFPAKVTYI